MNEQMVTLLMENGPGDMDVKAFIMQKENDYPPRIVVGYQTMAYEGDQIDAGIEGPDEGQLQLPDDLDLLDGKTPVSLAVQFLNAHYATQASASFFHPGIWYIADDEVNSRTGERTSYSFHLKGFTPEQEEEIYNELSL